MLLLIFCQHCQTSFNANLTQNTMLNAMAERGQQFAMISCANCQQSFPVNPTTLSAPSPDNEPPLPCPACADGLVSLIENSEQTFWGCGACGNVWHARPSLTT